VEAVFGRGTIQTIHDKQIEIKRAVPRDSMPPSPRTLHRSPAHAAHPGYDHPPPEPWNRRGGPPPHFGGSRGYSGGPGGYSSGPGGYRGGHNSVPPPHGGLGHHGGYGGARSSGMRSPPHHGGHHHIGGPPQPFTPPAVVTGAFAACLHPAHHAAGRAFTLMPTGQLGSFQTLQASRPTWPPRQRARQP
jgi:hypothetical protein